MNAIIIAAGSGKRISEDVKDLPKSLLMVNGKPIIVHQIQGKFIPEMSIIDLLFNEGRDGAKEILQNSIVKNSYSKKL